MYVVIVGGGRTGAQLARLLIQHNHDVHVVEDREDILARLHREIPTELIHEGNPVYPEVLERAGIRQADVLAAVTSDDDRNLLTCYLSRTLFNVGRTIARVNNPGHDWLFSSRFNVDVTISPASIIANLISEQMSMGDMMTLAKLYKGNYSLVEEKISENAHSIGKAIKDLGLSDQCVIAGIIRNGDLIVPHGNTVLQADDEILAVTDTEGANYLAELLLPEDDGQTKNV
ncbi:MAG: NAD-binding protein [Chloroflexi bacterium]|nr:NAD-binding protein [Chloroflexota bacterium]